MAVAGQHLDGRSKIVDLDTFDLGLLQFPFINGHLRPGSPIEDMDLFGTQSKGGSGRVNGRVSTANDGDSFPRPEIFLLQVDFTHEGHAVNNPVKLLAPYSQLFRLVGTCSDVNSIVIPSQVFQLYFHPNRGIGMNFNPQIFQLLKGLFHHLAGEAIRRNSHIEHSPFQGKGLINGHGISYPGQIVGRRESRRSSPYNGNLFFLFLFPSDLIQLPPLRWLNPEVSTGAFQ